jgi:transmembrane sensor
MLSLCKVLFVKEEIPMDEQRIVELLTRKIAGEASSQELGELSYLLTKYPEAVYYEALLEQVWELGKPEKSVSQSDVFSKHKSKFSDELKFSNKNRGIKGFIRRPAMMLIALVCLVVSSVVLVLHRSKPSVSKNIEVIAGKGVRKEVKLPDGTIVRLNSESKISYDADMLDKDLREVSLTGEAYFNVAHDKKRAFIATTHKIAVRVLGTEFNIKEYPGESRSETTLLKGSIELSLNARSEQKFLLKPSEKFALVESKHKSLKKEENSVMVIEYITPVTVGNKEYISEISWVENKLVFENESFEDLLPKLERWYNVRIDLQDPEIKSFRFTGIFTNENIVQALEAMKLIKSFNFKLTANEVKIY